ARGGRVVTGEGRARGARRSALQQAFIDMGAAQCGICTPGMLVTSMELLRRTRGRVPGEDEVREALAGNLCRCTGYQKIVDAVRAAARPARSAGAASRNRKPAPRRPKPARAKANGRATVKRRVAGPSRFD